VQLWTLHGEERTKEFLSRTLSYFALLAVAVIAGTTVVSSDVVVLLASKRYLQAHVLLPWLVAGLIISSLQVFFKAGLMLQHKPMKVAQATTLAAIFNMGLNVALIPRIGILGAAIATFLSYALWVFLMARAAFAVFPFAIQWPAIARYIGSAAVAWFVASRIDLPETLTRLLARGSVFCLVYAVCVLAVDKCIRHNLVRYAQECAIFSGSQQ
jgi:O-antigen/teichoic acid export membrane protein